MTYAEQVEIFKNSATLEEFRAKYHYRLGWEGAKEDIENGTPNLAENQPHLVDIFGADWVRGYTEYWNAWNVLQGK